MGLAGLNLGGADKDPTTVTNMLPLPDAERPESQDRTAGAGMGANEQGTVNQVVESVAKNETDTPVNDRGEGTRENDLEDGRKMEPRDPQVNVPEATPAHVGGEDAGLKLADAEKKARVDNPNTKLDSERRDVLQEQVDATLDEENVAARWSSHPIMRYSVGDWHFENGLLVLREQKDADAFQEAYDGLPISEQSRLKKLDLAEAEALVRQAIAANGGATKSIDSSVGDRAPNKAVGVGTLGE